MADQTLARHLNERAVFTRLRLHGAASRAELARDLSLTPATVTRVVAELIDQGLLREAPVAARQREPGRPGVAVDLEPDGAYFLGFEVGVGILRAVLLDLSLAIAHRMEQPVARSLSPAKAADAIRDHLATLVAQRRFKGRIRAVGVTVPGLVDLRGHILHLPILGWRDVGFQSLLAQKVTLPCRVENNTNAAAFGAIYSDPAIPTDCAIYLKLGMGCGGAAIVQGRLFRGATGTAAEFGHVKLAETGPRCNCGQTGCLETYVNLQALAAATGSGAGLSDRDLRRLPMSLAAAVASGDRKAKRGLGVITRRLSQGLASLINAFNPSAVVLGGALLPVLEVAQADLRESTAARIVPGVVMPDLRLSTLGDFDSAIGAACLAHQSQFDLAFSAGT